MRKYRSHQFLKWLKTRRCSFLCFFGFLLLFLVFDTSLKSLASSFSDSEQSCFNWFQNLELDHQPQQRIKDFNDLTEAFTHGFLPDLSNRSQRDAFELYRKTKFGNPDTELNPGTLEEIAQILEKHPSLEKEPFRNFQLQVEQQQYPVTKELAAYLNSEIAAAAQIRANLFSVEANSGFWKKIFQYQEIELTERISKAESIDQKEAFRKRIRKLKEDNRKQWQAFLDSKISPKVRAELLDLKHPIKKRAQLLYSTLLRERKNMLTSGKDIRLISQAMIDLVQTIGYHDPVISNALKSPDGMSRIEAYRKILDERDRFSIELGFSEGIDPLSIKKTFDLLRKLEDGIIADSKVSNLYKTNVISRTIRHLSLVESPFRSCIGGSDCSSRTYLSRAMDPNYHYFTITNKKGVSSGHFTVVLGDGMMNGRSVKAGFLDKVQNISNADLPLMLEAVRQSLEEKKYQLVIPEFLGGYEGIISNDEETRNFIKNNIKLNPYRKLIDFRPHAHKYRFPDRFSRADWRLVSYSVVPLELPRGVELKAGSLIGSWKLKTTHGESEDIDLNRIAQTIVNFRNSSDSEERLEYLSSMKVIRGFGLNVDPEFNSILKRWIADSSQDFQLRKQILIYEWIENSKPLPEILSNFNEKDQVQIIQNLLDTPRYMDLIFSDKKIIPKLIYISRNNIKLRNLLINGYAHGDNNLVRAMIESILKTPVHDDSILFNIIDKANLYLNSADLDGILKFQNELKNSHLSFASELEDQLIHFYFLNLMNEVELEKVLLKCFILEQNCAHDFGQKLLKKARSTQNRTDRFHSQALTAFQEILSLKSSDFDTLSFTQAARLWLQSEAVHADLKASFLLVHFGLSKLNEENFYESYKSSIHPSQISAVKKAIHESTMLIPFENLVAEKSGPGFKDLLAKGKIQSFEFYHQSLPESRERASQLGPLDDLGRLNSEDQYDAMSTESFEIQATPVTQLQWFLVMGETPSRFNKSGPGIEVNGARIKLDPNRPVEQVSWEDTERFIEKLNKLDPHYDYRLPTEAEWEYAARAGTETAYSFGDNSKEIDQYAWYAGNSNQQTHDVASLKSNPGGLYDVHGNVWEWVNDRYRKHALDSNGLSRVLRGGSFSGDPRQLRSDERAYGKRSDGSDHVGFRLVRTAKGL